MKIAYILAAMFFTLFVINLITLFGVVRTDKSERVIFIFRIATAITMSAAVICSIITIALYFEGV